MMHPAQINLFATATASAASLIGTIIDMERRIDRPCRCGKTKLVIAEAKGPHINALYCANCGQHRGWLPKKAADFLAESIRVFGTGTEFFIRDDDFENEEN